MSGSPILQNGKLIGAVTHVLIDDPTTGYAIFAENMLKEAESTAGSAQVRKASKFKKYYAPHAVSCSMQGL